MSLSAALHATLGALRRRPADLLPFYMLGAAVTAIARVGTFAGFAVAYVYLETTGRLDAVRSTIAGSDLNPPDPEVQPDAFAEWVEGLAPLLEPLFPPVAVAVLALSFGLTLLAIFVLSSVVSAGQIAACDARVRDARGLAAGLVGARQHWWTFFAAYVLEAFVWLAASVTALSAVGLAAAGSPAAGLLVAPVAFLVWLIVVTVARALFAFVPVAVVVDDVGIVGGIRGSVAFVRGQPVDAVGYYGISIGALVAFATVAGVLSLVDAQAVSAPLVFLVVSPSLDLVKTGLFSGYRGALSPPAASELAVREQTARGLRRGLSELGAFVREHPGLHVASLAVGATGAVMGWVAVDPLVGSLSTSIESRLADHVPPVAALHFFANNWTVAIGLAFSGVALVVPAALGLWFNGFVLGIFARLEVAPSVLVAFLVPHGLIELPSLVVAGALGGYLGLASWRVWRGHAGRSALVAAMERAFWVLVGLGVLFAIAGLIEAFVSPYYYRLFL